MFYLHNLDNLHLNLDGFLYHYTLHYVAIKWNVLQSLYTMPKCTTLIFGGFCVAFSENRIFIQININSIICFNAQVIASVHSDML